jgi:hypothetical protein
LESRTSPVCDELFDRLQAALAFLRAAQLPTGEFPAYKAPPEELIHERTLDSTPFATTYILHALSYVEHPPVDELTAPALDFLEAAMEPHGVWRYWPAEHPRHGAIPPDLDDTCCASAVLLRFGRPALSNRALILANRDRRGLFYTWLVPRPARRLPREYWSVTLRQLPTSLPRVLFWTRTAASPSDVDCVVNANVLSYLGEFSEAQPVADFLSIAVHEGRAGSCDKYHRNACAFYYAVSRAYASGVKALEPLRAPLTARLDTTLSDAENLASAEVALAICAMLNLGHRPPNFNAAIERIVASQQADGSWPPFALYWGGPPERNHCWGSRALTTGLCVEAIARSTPGGRAPVQRRSRVTN